MKTPIHPLAILLLSGLGILPLRADPPVRNTADAMNLVRVNPAASLGRIADGMHGQFIEHLGTCISGGIFDPASPLADERGFRKDVLAKTRELNPRLLRWPGGTYTKIYHWQDGIGPVEERRKRPNLIWGGVEDHLFGTNEFIQYCRAIGAEPYISVNMATGTAEEAANWVEYCNGTGDTHYANLRRKHGHPQPHHVKFWGLGNEEEAEPDAGVLQDPAVYAKTAWHFAKLMKLQDPSIRLIVCGVSGNMDWNRTVLDSLHTVADHLAIHFYFRTTDHPALLGSVAEFDRSMGRYAGFLRSYPEKPEQFSHWHRFPPRQGPVTLAIDEWGLWNGGDSGRENLWGLNHTYQWRDAIAVASWLNAMHRHAAIIGFANWAQLANIIAPIRTDARGSIRQTVFHPLSLYAAEAGRTSVGVTVESEANFANLPALDACASLREPDGSLAVFIVNRDGANLVDATVSIAGNERPFLGGIELTAPSMDAENTLEHPDRDCVKRRAIPAAATPPARFAPGSITCLRFGPAP